MTPAIRFLGFALFFAFLIGPASSDDRLSGHDETRDRFLTPYVTGISPASAHADEWVTVTGSNFEPHGLRITVGGFPAQVNQADSRSAVFRVPERALPGPAEVVIRNSRGSTTSIDFTVLERVFPAVPCGEKEERTGFWRGEKESFEDGDDSLIRCLSPIAARRGEQVTVRLKQFAGWGVRLTLNGLPLTAISVRGESVTFVVPQAVSSGSAVISASRHGESSGMRFTVLDGILLPGSPSAPAISATFNLPPKGVDESEIQDHVILNRLDIRLADNATVGQLNAALQEIDGGIVSMAVGMAGVTIGVPPQPTAEGLQQLSDRLQLMPGIQFSTVGREPGPMGLPFTPAAGDARLAEAAHLLPERFPAAWNASALSAGCSPIPVLITDFFGPTPAGFAVEVPSFQPPANAPAPLGATEAEHGYDIARLVAADFTNGSVPGTNPFSSCLSVQLIQLAGQTQREQAQTIAQNFPPSGKFIMNYSIGYNDDCFRPATPTQAATFDCHPPLDSTLAPPLERAKDAITWKEFTAGRWGEFLVSTSAGNSLDAESTPIYPGMGDSRYTNMISISRLNDPLFNFMTDASLWSPTAGFPQFDTLVPAAADVSSLQSYVIQHGLDHAVADNSLVVGGTTAPQGNLLANPVAPEALAVPTDSEMNSQVLAVSENIFNTGHDGTSYAAPQVAGLAAYLWTLSPTLRQLPSSLTVQAIVANAWTSIGPASGLIDAYATVLSLDAPGPITATNSPVRLAIMDVNNDGVFDENDLKPFLEHYFARDANGDLSNIQSAPTTVDYGRYDLNGDGFTGGSFVQRFDLDRIGSAQFGTTIYSDRITEEIEGQQVSFDESAATDVQIFCYYAYSPLFQGDTGQRTNLLGGHCFNTTVRVDPANAHLSAGAQQQFSAAVHGNTDPRVLWSVDGVAGGNSDLGTISPTGLYIAPSATGNHTVRATSVADASAFGEATVTVSSSACVPDVKFLDYLVANNGGLKNPDPDTSSLHVSDNISGPDSFASIDLSYASFTATAQASKLHPYVGGLPGTQDGGAIASGGSDDRFIIVPADPARIGENVTVTIKFSVSATPQVSGDRAQAGWNVFSGFPWLFSTSGRLSTIDGKTSNPTGGTFSVPAQATLGQGSIFSLSLAAFVATDCVAGHACPDPTDDPTLTGTGSITAKYQWLGMSITDSAGRPVPFSVCSASGKNYQ